MNQLKTDFLCETSNFWAGMGSVLNLGGVGHQYNTSDNPDEIAISHDWHMVGQDLRGAVKQANSAYRPKPHANAQR